MMTIMVRGAEDDPDGQSGVLKEVVRAISEILGHRIRDSAPASIRSMKFRWPPRGLRLEARATAGRQSFPMRYLGILASSLIQFWCERFDRRAGAYDAPRYREELRSNTDFRKYDGVLRMVLDVTETQAEGIARYLKREHELGRLVYGVHVADTALMTCLVFNLEQSAHLHFIDGSNGGFAKAAQEFKAQLGDR